MVNNDEKGFIVSSWRAFKEKKSNKKQQKLFTTISKSPSCWIITASSYNKWDELKFGADFKQFWPTIKRPKLPLKATGVFLCFSSISAELQPLFTLCVFLSCVFQDERPLRVVSWLQEEAWAGGPHVLPLHVWNLRWHFLFLFYWNQ